MAPGRSTHLRRKRLHRRRIRKRPGADEPRKHDAVRHRIGQVRRLSGEHEHHHPRGQLPTARSAPGHAPGLGQGERRSGTAPLHRRPRRRRRHLRRLLLRSLHGLLGGSRPALLCSRGGIERPHGCPAGLLGLRRQLAPGSGHLRRHGRPPVRRRLPGRSGKAGSGNHLHLADHRPDILRRWLPSGGRVRRLAGLPRRHRRGPRL